MKFHIPVLFSILLFTSTPALPQSAVAGPLSEEELLLFCSNKEIWGELNVSVSQCLEPSRSCSNEIAEKKIDWTKATQALYTCIFKKLGIEFGKK